MSESFSVCDPAGILIRAMRGIVDQTKVTFDYSDKTAYDCADVQILGNAIHILLQIERAMKVRGHLSIPHPDQVEKKVEQIKSLIVGQYPTEGANDVRLLLNELSQMIHNHYVVYMAWCPECGDALEYKSTKGDRENNLYCLGCNTHYELVKKGN